MCGASGTDSAGCRLAYVNGGEQALDDPNADLISTMLSGVSQWESAIKSTRVAAAYAQKRARGDYPATPNRLFGYTHDGELHPTETPRVREAATRILAGESLHRIACEWEDSGVTTTAGGATDRPKRAHYPYDPNHGRVHSPQAQEKGLHRERVGTVERVGQARNCWPWQLGPGARP